MKKLSGTKKRLSKQSSQLGRPALIVLLMAGLAMALIYKRPIQAASDRAKTATGVIFGGGIGAAIAAGAGNAKWAPLGFVGAGLATGLTIRAVRKRRARRKEMEEQQMQPQQKRHYYKGEPDKMSDYPETGMYRKYRTRRVN